MLAPAPAALVAAAVGEPGAPAILIDDDVVSYAELDERVGRMARALADRGARPGTFVTLLLPRCADLIVAMHAVLRTGAAYIPLDPTHPIDRITYALDDSEPVLVVTTSDIATRLPGLPCLPVDTTGFPGPPLPVQAVSPEDAAYTIYTSGSTGRPKGVIVTHRGLHNLLVAMADIAGLAPGARIVATTTVSFDIAVVELLLPLVCGATVVLARERTTTDPAALISLIERSRADVLQATPALWQTLVDERRDALRGLRCIVGGDSLPVPLADDLRCCTVGVTNVYGPTETTVWSTAAQLTERPGPPPIGRPLRATTVHVLDDRLSAVPPGAVGELYIGGAGLARGYLGRPVLTASRFVANPFGERGDRLYRTGDFVRVGPDGQLEFLGRSDFQVKVNGHRIELGEIESVLAAADGVSGCVVTAHRSGDAPYLVAYVVPARDAVPGVTRLDPVRATALTERARRFLPVYMVPTVFIALERFPLTLNGKVDRAALPDPSAVSTGGRPPVDDDQAALCDLYADVLALPEVSIDDDFIRLGGGSVLAHTLIDRIRRTYGVEVPLPDLFAEPIGELAARIRQFPTARPRVRPMRTAGGIR